MGETGGVVAQLFDGLPTGTALGASGMSLRRGIQVSDQGVQPDTGTQRRDAANVRSERVHVVRGHRVAQPHAQGKHTETGGRQFQHRKQYR